MEWWEIVRDRRIAKFGDHHGSKTAFANAVGVSISRISDIENGTRKNPSLKTLRRLAFALELTVAQVIGDELIYLPEEDLSANKNNTRDLLRPATVLQLTGSLPTKEGAHNAALSVVVPDIDRIRNELQVAYEQIGSALADLNALAPHKQQRHPKADTAGDSSEE